MRSLPLTIVVLLLATAAPAAGQWNPNVLYAEREAALKAAIAARPNDMNALVDLGAFCLKPLAMRTVAAADGKVRTFLLPLRANPFDLDMCRLYLDHRTGLARVLNDQATDLRTNRVHEEDRADGRYRVATTPSAADYERARQLDAQDPNHYGELHGGRGDPSSPECAGVPPGHSHRGRSRLPRGA